MKKILLSAFVVIVFGVYAYRQSLGNSINGTDTPIASTTDTPTGSTTGTPQVTPGGPGGNSSGVETTKPPTTPATTPPPVVTPKPTGIYKDGQYTGPVTDAFYGNYQVKAIISGGKLTDVQFLAYPSDRGTSRRINEESMPILKSEAIKAQSANVDIISGATQSSLAFQESLGAALAEAKI